MPHYCDGTDVRIGDVATRAPSPGDHYDGGLVDGEGGNVRLASVAIAPVPYEGAQVVARRADVEGQPVVTFGVVAQRTCTAAALRLVRRARALAALLGEAQPTLRPA
jgi:hypothetical protein